MRIGIDLMERGFLPEWFIRFSIRVLCRERLNQEQKNDCEAEAQALNDFVKQLKAEPVAVLMEKVNEQHYEVPAAFFKKVLGKHLKYSSCYWHSDTTTLNQAEAAMLKLTCERAELSD